MERKFKKGDRVRIRTWSDMEKEFGLDAAGDIKCLFSFTKHMRRLCGRVATVSRHSARGEVQLEFDNAEGTLAWTYSTDMLERVCDKVVITSDGINTTAKLYNGREIIREAKATCSPSDTFDFETGARLAFTRLLPEPEKQAEAKQVKVKTLRDVVAERQPDCVGSKYVAGVRGCPHDYPYLGVERIDGCSYPGKCAECWSRPYTPPPKYDPDEVKLSAGAGLRQLDELLRRLSDLAERIAKNHT